MGTGSVLRTHAASIERGGIWREVAREILGIDHVMRDDIGQLFKPEKRELREHPSLIGYGRGQNHIESREPVGGDDQQAVAEIVNVADFSAATQLEPWKFSARNDSVHLWSSQG